jgi:hypothetical protein
MDNQLKEKIDHECGSTFASNCGTTTPYGLLRIQNIHSLGKMESKENKKEKPNNMYKEYQE